VNDDIFKKLNLNPSQLESITKAAKMSESMSSRISEQVKAMNSIKMPTYSVPEYSMPNIPELPRIPTPEERNDYQSADVLVRRLADTVVKWKESLDDHLQPAILAILSGGIQIQVTSLAVEGFHGIRIDGTLNGSVCMMLTHQASAQLLCYAVEVTEEEPRRGIGFVLGNNEHIST